MKLHAYPYTSDEPCSAGAPLEVVPHAARAIPRARRISLAPQFVTDPRARIAPHDRKLLAPLSVVSSRRTPAEWPHGTIRKYLLQGRAFQRSLTGGLFS
jgi:hypothetical protein